MGTSDYWLAQWIDENGIRGLRNARRVLASESHVDALRDRVGSIPWTVRPLVGENGHTLIAGQTMDLSGSLGCYHPNCLRQDVDSLFCRVWHYFDTIVVVGLAPQYASQLLEEFDDDDRERFLAFVETFLYLREIGAEDMLVFREKPPACSLHVEKHAEEHGVVSLLNQRQAWREELAARGEIVSLERHGEHWHYDVRHPAIEHMAVGVVSGEDAEQLSVETLVFDDVFSTYAAHLVSDIWAAQTLGVPLGSAVSIHGSLLDAISWDVPSPDDVLFELALPFVEYMPARELIKLRRDNRQYFDAFRSKLESAARERLRIQVEGIQLANLRHEIEQDLIQPELINIERQLRVARDLLSPKLIASVVVGSAVTTVGLLSHMPLLATTGAAGVGTGLLDYKNYIDGQREVRTSDMYFLWKAIKAAERTH